MPASLFCKGEVDDSATTEISDITHGPLRGSHQYGMLGQLGCLLALLPSSVSLKSQSQSQFLALALSVVGFANPIPCLLDALDIIYGYKQSADLPYQSLSLHPQTALAAGADRSPLWRILEDLRDPCHG